MKPPLKLNIAFFHFPYAGNGACSAESPDVREWEVETAIKMKADPRIGEFYIKSISETPITMSRNMAIKKARELGVHLVLFVDSDQQPNLHRNEPWYKPFWDEAFNFIYNNYQAGPRLVFAPYCGPPNGTENCYVFKAVSLGNHSQETAWKLDAYSRDEASMMTGIQEAAAGPTGMILIDLRLCDLIEPVAMSKEQIVHALSEGRMTPAEGLYALRDGMFYYEWENQYCDQKASTEDVTFTRDIALAGLAKLGYNPVFCAWDSWIGHHKPWTVGKPKRYTLEHVNASYRKAVLDNVSGNEVIADLSKFIDPELANLQNRAAKPALSHITPQLPEKANGHKQSAAPVIYGDMRTADTQTGMWCEHGHAPIKHREALQDLVKSHAYYHNRALRILEIGSWLGSTATAMADSTTNSQVHCVDTWGGSDGDITGELVKEAGGGDVVYETFKRNIGDRLNETIFPWRMTSAEAAAKHWEPFDIIFIDADHTYEGCKADIEQWWKHLRDDGIMCGHDFETQQCPGVTKAVYESFGEKAEAFGFHPQGCLWKVRKSDCPAGLLSEVESGKEILERV